MAALEHAEGHTVVVDCLTLWLSNLMAAGRDVQSEGDRLAGAVAAGATTAGDIDKLQPGGHDPKRNDPLAR